MSRLRIEIEWLRSGQPRAYADTVREVLIRCSSTWDSTTGERDGTWEPQEEHVKAIVKMLVCKYAEEGEGNWASPRLKTFKKEGRGVWRVLVVEPYTD